MLKTDKDCAKVASQQSICSCTIPEIIQEITDAEKCAGEGKSVRNKKRSIMNPIKRKVAARGERVIFHNVQKET